jgi:hypothetical protein
MMKCETLTFIRVLGSGDRCIIKASISRKGEVTFDWNGEPPPELEPVIEHRTWVLETFEHLAVRWNMRLTFPLHLPPDVMEIWEFLPHLKAQRLGVFEELREVN